MFRLQPARARTTRESARGFFHALTLTLALGPLTSTALADARPAPLAQDVAYQEREVLIPSGEGRVLAGTLTLPVKGLPPFPVALSLTGSGPHLRDGNRRKEHPYRPFREIAQELAAHGIAMLRLDDRGVGRSTGDADAATGDDVAADAHTAIAWLRKEARIDGRRVAIIGHSFGGAVAPLVAVQDRTVAAVVLMGAPALTFRETMRYQHRYDIENDPTIKPEDRERELERRMAAQARNVARSAQKWRPWSQDRDPLPVAGKVRCPVLILQGLTDRAVSPEEARTLERTMRESGNSRVRLHLFAGLNHHFNVDPTGATNGYDQLPSQDLAPVFLDTLGNWLESALASSAAPRP